MKKTIVFFAAALALSSCQNAGYLMETYNKINKATIKTDGGSFWVWDRPDLHKILTSPTPGTMVAPILVGGSTLGLVKVDPIAQAHRDIAQKYLASTGRTCEIKTSIEIWRPEYEHTYDCN